MKVKYLVMSAIIIALTFLSAKIAWEFAVTIPFLDVPVSYPFRWMTQYIVIGGLLIAMIPLLIGLGTKRGG